MATSFPTYPATTFEQAVELAIFSSNQLHNIINADPLSTVETEDGDIPSVRKALIDNLYFKTPAITWAEGTSVTLFNQLYTFSGGTTGTALWYAPTATTTSPIVMGSSPEEDANWKLYGWNTYSKEELNSTSGASYIGTPSNITLQDSIGNTLPDTVAIFTVTNNYSSFRSRGFYSAGDGGGATWNATGNTDISLAGTHVVTEGKVYNANGYEYLLDISSGTVNVLQNGAKGTTIAKATTQTETDYICLGQVVNGIQNQLPIPVETDNNSDGQTGINPLVIEFKADVYRIGRSPIIPYNWTTYNFNNSRMFVTNANADGSITGRLDGIRFGYDEIKARYDAVGDKGWWGSLSLTGCHFNDGMLYGDQTLSKAITDCYSGCGWLILNGQYNTFNRMVAEQFVWPAVTKKAEVEATVFAASGDFDDNDVDYRYICDFLGADRIGNFYGNNYNDCQLTSGRRGIMRDDSDWSYIQGGTCAGSWWKFYDTTNNPSGVIPSYFMVVTGTGKNVSGMYISANGSTGADSNPAKGVVYTSAKGHFFSGIYTEWSYCNFVISKYLWGDSTDRRSMGLHIDSVSTYKDNATQYMNVKFEDGSFGYYDSNGTWQWPDAFNGATPTPQGIREMSIGTPVRDLGAFKHGGFDFKYATYNLWGQAGTADVDSLRGITTSKEMLNPYGLLASSGEVELPVVNPSMNSVIHVWIKDLTGNFDPKNLVLWQSASLENPKSNSNDFISYGESCIDFGNGYKLLTVANCRWNAFDGVSTWEAANSLRVIVDSATPIILKAVEAYSGGISFFPQGCDYKPMSGMDKVFGETAYYGQENGCGGGIFWPGDIVDTYLAVDRHDISSPWLGSSMSTYPKIVTGGFAEESGLSGDVSATVVSSDSSGSIVTASTPALLVAGSLVSIGGSQYRLLERIISGSTVTSNYFVQGYSGTAGASITISPVSSGYTCKEYEDLSVSGGVNAGSLTLGQGSSSAGDRTLSFYSSGGSTRTAAINVGSSSGNMQIIGNGTLDLQLGTTQIRNLQPAGSNFYNLGSSSLVWANIYSETAVTVVSDLDKKPVVEEFTDTELAAATQCAKAYRKYKLQDAITLKGEDGARYHMGTIAQYVMQAFTDNGLDWTKYGVITYEEWDATETTEAGHIYMVRYDELNSFINAAQEARLEKLEKLFMTT